MSLYLFLAFLTFLTIVIVAVACSRFTKRQEDLYVERFKSARPFNGQDRWS